MGTAQFLGHFGPQSKSKLRTMTIIVLAWRSWRIHASISSARRRLAPPVNADSGRKCAANKLGPGSAHDRRHTSCFATCLTFYYLNCHGTYFDTSLLSGFIGFHTRGTPNIMLRARALWCIVVVSIGPLCLRSLDYYTGTTANYTIS